MQSSNTILNKRAFQPVNLSTGTAYITREGGMLGTTAAGSMGTITDKWTIATWIKRQRFVSSTGTVFSLRQSPGSTLGEILFQNWLSTNDMRWSVRGDGSTIQNVWEIIDLPAYDLNADWEFFVFTYDYNAGTALWDTYWNGTVLNETIGSGPGDPYLDHATVNNPQQTGANKYISVGNFLTNDPPGFEGRIFNWSMWDRVLTSDEVTYLYNNGVGYRRDYTKDFTDVYSASGLNFHYTFDNGSNRGENSGSVARDLSDDQQGLATYTTRDLPGTNDATVFLEDKMSFMMNPGANNNGHYIEGPLCSNLFASDTNTLSFSLWYKRNPGQTILQYESILGSTTNYSTWSDGFGLYWNNDINLQFFVNNYATSFVGYNIGTSEEWRHIVGVYDGANTRLALYVDGVLAVEDTSAISANLLRTGTQNFYLGRLGNSNFPANRYGGGYYNEVAVYNKALSDDEITRLYNAGVPSDPSAISDMRLWWTMEEDNGDSDDFGGTPVVEDQSGNNLDGTPTIAGSSAGDGATFFRLSEDKPTFQNVSALFDSSTEYIETKSISPYLGIHGSDFTAACWFKPTSTPAASDEPIIFETTDPSDESIIQMYIDDVSDLHVKLYDTNGTLFKHFEGTVIDDDGWNYVAITYVDTGDVLTVYAGYEISGGVSDVTASMTKTVDNAGTMNNEGPQTVRFGNNAAHDTNFPGKIYSLTLWDDDLTEAELDEIFLMRSYRSPVSGNYGNYTSNTNLEYHWDWRNTYFVGDNRAPNRTAPSIDTSVGGVWPPSDTEVPPRFFPSGG